MSAPDTNIKKQERRHRGPLGGMKLAVGFAAVLFVLWVAWLFFAGDDPGDEAERNVVPGSEVVETEAGPADGSGATVVETEDAPVDGSGSTMVETEDGPVDGSGTTAVD